MIRYLAHSLCTVVCLALFACHNKELERNMMELCKDSISLPLDSFIFVSNNQECQNTDIQSPYKMIVYVDSASCSKCSVKMLYEWNDLLSLEKENRVDFVFILSAKDTLSLMKAHRRSALKHGIYIDTCNAFLRINPHIPQGNLYHTFMIDSTQKVNLVGNPLRNKKIEELFLNIIAHKD